jgi:hypothetical protein
MSQPSKAGFDDGRRLQSRPYSHQLRVAQNGLSLRTDHPAVDSSPLSRLQSAVSPYLSEPNAESLSALLCLVSRDINAARKYSYCIATSASLLPHDGAFAGFGEPCRQPR